MAELKTENSETCVAYLGGPSGLHVNLDSFRCFLSHFSALLHQINFGYVCIALLSIIMFISIFGGIKENYKWFILNQAIWDIAISYKFICNNWIQYSFYGIYTNSCFYNFETGWLTSVFGYSIDTNSYSALFLFSFMRYLGVYFPQKYKTLTRNQGIFYIIIIFNFFVIFTNIHAFSNTLSTQRKARLNEECILQSEMNIINQTLCSGNYDGDFQIMMFKLLFKVFSFIMFLKPLICLFLSFISAILIIFRVIKQFKFQYNHNQKDLTSSIRICSVILLQTLINLFVFFIESVKNIPLFMGNTFDVIIITSKTTWDCKNCYHFILSEWLSGQYGLAFSPVLQAIVQTRIFIESLIVLFIMTGYRESLLNFMKSPRKMFRKFITGETSDVTILVTHISSLN